MTVSLLCALSLLVSSTVFWQLRLVGITMSNDACCGKTEHIHTDECVPTQVLICGLKENTEELSAAACDIPEHIHSGACYAEHSVLICTVSDEDSEHEHEDTCYEAACILECQEQEHSHSEDCFSLTGASAEGHVHTDECYETVYSCGFTEEHEHSVSCYSDPGADLETAADWEATLPNSLSGAWPSDMIAVAQSQYGYQESDHNFTLAPDGETRMGYTRYGEWAGNPYGEWNAMFAAFCLHYADVPKSAFPVSSGVKSWQVKLDQAGLYMDAADTEPQEGNLVFFDDNTVGILIAVRGDSLYVIAGDIDDTVWQGTYDADDPVIIGYGCLNTAYQQFIGAEDDIPSFDDDISDDVEPPLEEAPIDSEPAPEEALPDEEETRQPDEEPYPDDEELPDSEAFPVEEEPIEEPEELFEGALFSLRSSSSDAPDYIGSIQTANAWQIVSERYTGNSQSDKIPVDGDANGEADLYLQKNVVPTNIENEFLVYLSIDKKMTWETFLDNSEYYLTSANNHSHLSPGSVVNRVNGNATVVYESDSTEGLNKYYMTIRVYAQKGDSTPLYEYEDIRYGGTPNCQNGTIFLRPQGLSGYILVQASVSLQSHSGGVGNDISAAIYLDEFVADFSVYQTVFDKVQDVMGENIEFVQVESCDGTTNFNAATQTLVWLPIENDAVKSTPEIGSTFDGWDENIAQLVYRVRLNTETDDFHSCADNMNSASGDAESYPVNEKAILSYHKEVLSGAFGTQSGTLTAAFPVPEVRGLHYNIAFAVTHEDSGAYLAGAMLALYEEDGETPVYQNGEACTVMTTADGIVKLRDLPCGTYVLKEIEPTPGYIVGESAQWQLSLSYTTNSAQLTQDTPLLPDDIKNMRWSGNDTAGEWQIPNAKDPFTYQVEVLKIGTSHNVLAGAKFSLAPSEPLLQGVTDETGLLRFDGTYSTNLELTLTEVEPPDGYYGINTPIRFKVVKATDGDGYQLVFLNADALSDNVSIELIENDDTATVRITVKNHTGYVLPETGGVGTNLFTFGGLLIMAAALMYGYMLRRSRERRSRK